MTTTATALCAMEIAPPPEGGAPDWVQLLPAGPGIAGRDGRAWTLPDPAALIEAFGANGADLPIDWEHATDIAAPQGRRAPAAGWITELASRDGAVWGRVEWTEEGRRSVASREYRYLSPTFLYDQERRIRVLTSAGLTNSPNLRLKALNRTDPEKELDMSNAAIAAALGLKADAPAEELVSAANRFRAAAETPDPARFAPREELTAALNRASTAETELAELKRAAETAAIEGAVDAQIEAGRIAPAGREFYLAACRAQGVEAFEAFAAGLPVIGGEQKRKDAPRATGKADHGLTEDELAACRARGMTPAEFAKIKAAGQADA